MVGIKILGPLEIEGALASPTVESYRQRAVLGLLALNPNRITSIDGLIEAVWDGRPPATAKSQIQICISGLRRVLAESQCPAVIETRSPGYRLVIDSAHLDSERMASLVAQARIDERAERLTDALESLRLATRLWRGSVLADVPSDRVQRAALPLTESRLAAESSRFRIELSLGRGRELVSELQAHVEAHPTSEDAYGHLMRALHQSGRSADALAVYHRARVTLMRQVGIEPSEELQRLHRAIQRGGLITQTHSHLEFARRAC